MDHQALYRQFRPDTFSQLAGQDAIVTALKNQIQNGRTAHAYLFCGTRGTGKTTTARLLSRAVNCLNSNDGEPCNECDACRAMKEGTAIDVVEIDAASNTSVDNIRQIRDEIAYPPMYLKKKVYIIDEVHMLSGGAFNALLKTLEEPPEHAMFILATTEYHKVPATILSRCQRYDFKRISGAEISNYLKFVCNESGAKFEDDAISSIAYAADGSMRDGLSILEKCLSSTNDILSHETVARVLGTVDDNDLFKLSSALAEKNAADAISVCEKAIAEGRDPILLTVYLMEHFRCLMVASLVKNPAEILQMNTERTKNFTLQSQKFSSSQIITILKSLTNVYKSQKESPNPKMMLEIGLAAISSHGQKQVASIPVIQETPVAPAVQKPVEVPEYVVTEQKTEEEIIQEDTPEPPEVMVDEKHLSLSEVTDKWGEICDYLIREKKVSLCGNLRLCRPIAESEDTLLLIFRPENRINHDLVEKPTNKADLQEAIWQYIGIKPKIHCCYTNETPAQAKQVMPKADIDALESEFGDFIKFED